METRVQGMETRVQGMETRVQGMETRMQGMETRVQGMETRECHKKLHALTSMANCQGTQHSCQSVLL
eukprot:200676-Chlamydomonas_euryale.AAC.1